MSKDIIATNRYRVDICLKITGGYLEIRDVKIDLPKEPMS